MNVEAVILAAGYSSRAEAFKMELMLDGKPILQHVIDAFQPICRRIIVVCGYQMERILPMTAEYGDQVEIVFNEEYSKGMFTSVRKGIRRVSSTRFFLTPGDYPLISTSICKRLLEHGGDYVKPSYQRHGGHPILLPSSCINEILAEKEDSNLKSYLAKQKIHYVEIEDESVLLDIDTQEDYQKLLQFKRQEKERREGLWI